MSPGPLVDLAEFWTGALQIEIAGKTKIVVLKTKISKVQKVTGFLLSFYLSVIICYVIMYIGIISFN